MSIDLLNLIYELVASQSINNDYITQKGSYVAILAYQDSYGHGLRMSLQDIDNSPIGL